MLSRYSIILLFIIKSSVLIDVHGKHKAIITALNPNVTVTSGQKAILTCIFNRTDDDVSSYQSIWIRQARSSHDADLILAHNQDLLIYDDRLNIQLTSNDYKLTITDVTIDDERTYVCEVNTSPPQKSYIDLYVQETPTFIDNGTLSPVVINEYDNVTIECQALGRPKPYITWFRRNNNENNQTKFNNAILENTTNGQLHLFNVTRSQMGHYECRASNGVNGHVISKDIELRVLFPPLIQTQSAIVYGTYGKFIQLRCTAIAPFDTKIYWQKMDTNKTINFQQQQQQQTNGDVTQTSLNIKDIDKDDFGSYRCIAESMAGKTHAVIELREHHRSTSIKVTEINHMSTARMPILKRNQISDQTAISIETNRASSCFSLLYLSFTVIHIIFYELT